MTWKTFAIKSLLFLLLFLAADWLCGQAFRALNQVAGDKFAREEYMRHRMHEELLIFGSSRGAQHYVASVISDTLGISAYNCGQPGNGVIYEYGRLQTVYARYTPRYILVDLFGVYDLDYCDNTRFLDFLKIDYGHNDSVDAIFKEIDALSPIKMRLYSYRYNSTICDLLLNTLLRNRGRYRSDGFSPLYGSMQPTAWPSAKVAQPIVTQTDTADFDPVKLKYMHKLASEVPEGCTMIFVISPCAGSYNQKHLQAYQRIADQHGILLLDYSNTPALHNRPDLFRNPNHMNEAGAKLFSSLLASDLKRILFSGAL